MKIDSVSTLIHRWANRNFTEKTLSKTGKRKIGNWSADNTKLYYGNSLVALHTKDYIFVAPCYNKRRFGLGYGTWDIVQAIPMKDEYKIYKVQNSIPCEDTLSNKDEFIHWVKKELQTYLENSNDLQYIAYLKEVLFDNRYKSFRNIDSFDIMNVTTPLREAIRCGGNVKDLSRIVPKKQLKLYRKDILNLEFNSRVHFEKYSGWSRTGYYTTNVNFKLSDVYPKVKLSVFLTKKEIAEWKFRNWHTTYGFTSIHDSRELYKDKEKRKDRESRLPEIREEKRKEKEKRHNKKRFELQSEFKKKLEEWKSSPSNHFYHILNLYQSLKLITIHYPHDTKLPYVCTSLGVKVSLEDAKNLYQSLKRLDAFNKPLNLARRNILISDYKVMGTDMKPVGIKWDYTNIEDLCLIIGCHNIPITEINDFIKRNNLNW